MKKRFLAAGALCAAILAITAKPSDPVLMKVGGDEVRLSEFEYLYHKNNTQQAEPQSIEQYVDMFVNFKLKVAAAEKAGLDTTVAFESEYLKFRNDLAEPYLRDAEVEEAQILDAYGHTQRDVLVSHIMLPRDAHALADSLRSGILDGTIKYEDAARRHSIDKPSAARGGLTGTVSAGRFPWAFEKAAYDTEVGGISPVVNSGFGLHIIRVEKSEPSRGEVHAAHILRGGRGMSDSAIMAEKAVIDSIYAELRAGADFADMARRHSQDPGTAQRGGDLGYFGHGRMVHEFDSVAFALPDSSLSEPFRTAFGWHIIRRLDSNKPAGLDEQREAIRKAIAEDASRSAVATDAYLDKVIARYNGRVDMGTISAVQQMAARHGGVMDSAMVAELAASKLTAVTFNGKNTTLAELAAYIPSVSPQGAENIAEFVRNTASDYLKTLALEQARADLAADNADYRNLINEYRDGILLFEISNREVWDKATADTTGLEQYFRDHRDKYRWETPRYKAIIIFAPNDSLLEAATRYAADSISASIPSSRVAAVMADRFGRNVKVERVIAAKGDNPITDYLGFGAERPAKPASQRWPVYAPFRAKVLDQPEEAADLRAAVVADYQASLEKAWLERLRKEIPVKINRKVLRSAK